MGGIPSGYHTGNVITEAPSNSIFFSLCPNVGQLVDGDGVITDGRLDDNDATQKLPLTQSAQLGQVCVGSHT